MKNLLTLIILLFFCNVFSQVDYPIYQIDSQGQKVVVMTIKQAMILDNNSELLSMFEELGVNIGEYDTMCIKVISDKEKVISTQKIEISKLRESITNKENQIGALQYEILQHIKKEEVLQSQVDNRILVLKEKDKQISKLKTKMILSGSIGGLTIIGLIFALLIR